MDDDLGANEDEEGAFVLGVGAVGEEAVEAGDLGEDGDADFDFGFADEFLAADEEGAAVGYADHGIDGGVSDTGQLHEGRTDAAGTGLSALGGAGGGGGKAAGEGIDAVEAGELGANFHDHIAAVSRDGGFDVEDDAGGEGGDLEAGADGAAAAGAAGAGGLVEVRDEVLLVGDGEVTALSVKEGDAGCGDGGGAFIDLGSAKEEVELRSVHFIVTVAFDA